MPWKGRAMKIWIWDEDRVKFRQVDSERLRFNSRGIQLGHARLDMGRGRWMYVPTGETKRDCWLKATMYERESIADLEKKLESIKKRILDRYGEEPE
jgi:hypothetical protein